jgi:hypothetical protein
MKYIHDVDVGTVFHTVVPANVAVKVDGGL